MCGAHTASLSLVGCHSLLDSDTANWLQHRATDAQQGAMKTLSAHIHTERTHGRKVLLSCTQGTTNLKSQSYCNLRFWTQILNPEGQDQKDKTRRTRPEGLDQNVPDVQTGQCGQEDATEEGEGHCEQQRQHLVGAHADLLEAQHAVEPHLVEAAGGGGLSQHVTHLHLSCGKQRSIKCCLNLLDQISFYLR